MSYSYFIPYLVVMAASTYAVRVIPFVLMRKKIENRFIKSFLYYVPYTVLAAMTFPAIFYSTGNVITAAAGTIAALVTAFFGLPLIVVALAAAGTALLAGLFL